VEQVMVGAVPGQPSGFQPRPYLLRQLDQVSHGVSVLTGAPGVGKTELAAAYARAKLAAGWRTVAWVHAGNTGSLLAGLAAVAEAAGLAGDSGREAADGAQATRRWLEADGDQRLLVLDDADDLDVLRPFIPAGAARVLVTSTRQWMAELGASVPVNVFSADEALAVLAGRTALADDAGAAAVAAELGYLPLTLTQAAAAIAEGQLGYRAYLKRVRVLPAEEHLARAAAAYPVGVAEAVLLSLEEAQAADRTGLCARVTELLSVLSAAGVRQDMLHAAGQAGVLAGRGHEPAMSGTLVERALQRLAERSLVTVSLDGRVVTAHRLVMQVVRDRLTRRERLPAVCRTAAAMLQLRADALQSAPDRPAVRDLAEQLTALLDNAAGADEHTARTLLSLRLGALFQLNELGDSAALAMMFGERLVADAERLLGPDHRDTLGARNNLAAACQAAGRLTAAIPLFQQVLSARERLLGPDHPETLTSQNNLAVSYQEAGRVPEAIPLAERTLAAREQVLGVDHPDTVNSRRNLIAAYRAGGRVADAIPLLERTLETRQRLLGPDHLATMAARNNLAIAYRAAGRAADAIPLAEQTFFACERLLGADHPKTLVARNNLAAAYQEAG
jgi:tetratricopeptide (TPR) repeat protein